MEEVNNIKELVENSLEDSKQVKEERCNKDIDHDNVQKRDDIKIKQDENKMDLNNDINCNKEKDDNDVIKQYKEFYNLNYYLKISCDPENIYIQVYNLEKLDGIMYKKKMNLHDIKSKNGGIFINNGDNLKIVFDKMINSINEEKYKITKEKEGISITLVLNIKNKKDEDEEVEFELDNIKKNHLDEYYNILIHEIKKMKKNKGINISKIEEDNKKIKDELEALKEKHKEIKDKMINEKKVEIKIIEKNNLEFVDYDKRSEVNICDRRKYGNEIIESLKKLDLSELKELRLYNDNISDLNKLKEIKIKKLKIFGLNDNKIIDISILASIKFESLEEIWLSNNNINNIAFLEKNFKSLIKIDLSSNDISDISILGKADLESLKELYLYHNKIKEIKILENGNFYDLEKLDLSLNLIKDVSVFPTDKSVFNKLIYLDLSHNEIEDINCFQDVKKKGYFFGFFQGGILNNLNDLYLINNKIGYGRNKEILDYLYSLKINFKI